MNYKPKNTTEIAELVWWKALDSNKGNIIDTMMSYFENEMSYFENERNISRNFDTVANEILSDKDTYNHIKNISKDEKAFTRNYNKVWNKLAKYALEYIVGIEKALRHKNIKILQKEESK